MIRSVVIRPWLWWTAVTLAIRMKPDRGWVPPREYLELRAQIYGAPLDQMPARAFVDYLRWCRRFRPRRIR